MDPELLFGEASLLLERVERPKSRTGDGGVESDDGDFGRLCERVRAILSEEFPAISEEVLPWDEEEALPEISSQDEDEVETSLGTVMGRDDGGNSASATGGQARVGQTRGREGLGPTYDVFAGGGRDRGFDSFLEFEGETGWSTPNQ